MTHDIFTVQKKDAREREREKRNVILPYKLNLFIYIFSVILSIIYVIDYKKLLSNTIKNY